MRKRAFAAAIAVVAMGGWLLSGSSGWAQGQQEGQRAGQAEYVVRLAELEIDPAQLEAYKAALREEIAASIRLEPGVLKLYAVSVKDAPNQIRLFETYASPSAYQAHLQSSHFKKYKSVTQGMVKSLKLIETVPVMLGSK